ncbi:MAG: hypothetical protein ISS48_01820 [Candidatus Aenigmarchaeota archaeon]|nr:hypothetical protein [Candidatus Aenigmarchaeota archaeon]
MAYLGQRISGRNILNRDQQTAIDGRLRNMHPSYVGFEVIGEDEIFIHYSDGGWRTASISGTLRI